VRKYKTSWYRRLWRWLSQTIQNIVWWFQGVALEAELKDAESVRHRAAQNAVRRVVMETDIAPDCVSATIVRGGPTIMVRHDDAWEAFVHNSYSEAAQEAINWINRQGDEISTSETSDMNRKQRRAFSSQRRKTH